MKKSLLLTSMTALVLSVVAFTTNAQPAQAAFGSGTTFLGKIYAGDGGDALNAYLDNPGGFALDASGNFVIADTANNVIRKIDAATNIITTLAGTGNIGGRNDSLTKSTFSAPLDVDVGSNGIIYVADTGNGKIRKIGASSTGTVTRSYRGTVVTTKGKTRITSTSVIDIKRPTSIALDGSTIYIAENSKNKILTVPTSGGIASEWLSINTPWRVYVNGDYLYVIHKGQTKVSMVNLTTKTVQQLMSGLKDASGLVVRNGLLYVTAGENGIENQIYTVNLSTGASNLLVERRETEWYNYGGDILFKGDVMYILFSRGSSIYRLDEDGNNEVRVAGVHRYGDTDGHKSVAVLGRPKSFALSSDKKSLYVLENHKLKKFSLTTDTLQLLAGSAMDNYTENTGGTAGRMSGPTSIVLSRDGKRIYFADRNNSRIRYLDLATDTFRYLTGAGHVNGDAVTNNGYAEGSPCASTFTTGVAGCAYFNRPNGIAISKPGGTLYIADTQNHVIRKVIIATGKTTLIAGKPGTSGLKDGRGKNARFKNPFSLSLSSDGATLYVADRDNNAIRSVRLRDGLVQTIAGNGAIGYREGRLASARLALPEYVYAASKNILYFTEAGTNRIREINLQTRLARLVSGKGTRGSVNGTRTSSTYNGVKGLILLNSKTLLVADQSNDLIRSISL
jgi:sugar lactone lactonase YvrE